MARISVALMVSHSSFSMISGELAPSVADDDFVMLPPPLPPPPALPLPSGDALPVPENEETKRSANDGSATKCLSPTVESSSTVKSVQHLAGFMIPLTEETGECDVGDPAEAVNCDRFRAKMVVIGDSGVGKTTLVDRFCRPGVGWEDVATCRPTVCMDMSSVRVNFADGHCMWLDIFDTAGTERFHCVPLQLMRNADVVVVVGAAASPTLVDSLRNWISTAAGAGSRYSPPTRIAVVNKTDLLSTPQHTTSLANRVRHHTEDLDFADYWTISAKNRLDVVQLVCSIAARARRHRDADPARRWCAGFRLNTVISPPPPSPPPSAASRASQYVSLSSLRQQPAVVGVVPVLRPVAHRCDAVVQNHDGKRCACSV